MMQALHNQTTDRPLTGLSRESQMPAMMAVLMVCLMEHWTACLTEFLFECLTERHWESVLTWTGPTVDASTKVLEAIDSAITHGIAPTAELFPIASWYSLSPSGYMQIHSRGILPWCSGRYLGGLVGQRRCQFGGGHGCMRLLYSLADGCNNGNADGVPDGTPEGTPTRCS